MAAILLLNSTKGVIKGEEQLRRSGVPCLVVPVPEGIASESGIAISVAEEHLSLAETLLSGIGLESRGCGKLGERGAEFDLLSTVEQGGCSAKLPPDILFRAVGRLEPQSDPNLLVGIDICDDAGVYRLSDDMALIETTDFFPPVCSEPYVFGQIAAANALSDVYAMGGRVITAMNIVMFPASGIPLEVLHEIVRGGQDKVREAGGVIVGGHTIADFPPKYGLAVTGIVHPERLISIANAEPDQLLILTKPIGTGTVMAGKRIGLASADDYKSALDSMKQLNREVAAVMQEFNVRAATDVTGFGLLGHGLNIARESGVTLEIDSGKVPVLPGALGLIDGGCIPGASFRNLAYVEEHLEVSPGLPYTLKMLALDPQTSGGILLCAPPETAHEIISELRARDCPYSSIIGRTVFLGRRHLRLL